jgi:hypothetical protein
MTVLMNISTSTQPRQILNPRNDSNSPEKSGKTGDSKEKCFGD